MTARKVVTRSGGHSRGLMPSIKNRISIPWESKNELRFYQWLELSPLVLSFMVQAVREHIIVDGKPAIYYPDVQVFFNDGTSCYVEVKPELKCRTSPVKARLTGIREHYRETNQQFYLITDEWLAKEPRASNLERLMYHRRQILLSKMEKIRLSGLLSSHQPQTVSELISLVGEEKAWLLLGLSIVGVDLELPMIASTNLFLTGGHRHANFFS